MHKKKPAVRPLFPERGGRQSRPICVSALAIGGMFWVNRGHEFEDHGKGLARLVEIASGVVIGLLAAGCGAERSGTPTVEAGGIEIVDLAAAGWG